MSSLTSYEFFAPPKIVFGWGRREELGPLARGLGSRAFIVWGSRTLAARGVGVQILESLVNSNVEPVELTTVQGEPEVADVDHAAGELRRHKVRAGDLVIGIGGGSAIDLAKAAAAMATNTEGSTVQDYLEGVGRGLQLTRPPLPILAMPTTAGTGSEATKNAVISSYDPPFKKSLRSELMVPRVVLVDPELSTSVPPEITAHTGMDAITQLVESYISRRARPIPQALAIQGLRLAVPALPIAVNDGANRAAREAMAHAALLSGIALANSGLGMAHGVAAALGVHCRTAHGLACAVMLPMALLANRAVCETQYAELAAAIGIQVRDRAEAADRFVASIGDLCRELQIPRQLSALGVEPAQLPAIVASSRGNSMDGNPRPVPDDELARLLEANL